MNQYKITRVEVIDHRTSSDKQGKVLVIRDDNCSISFDIQDDGRTIKIFVNDVVNDN